MMQYLNDNNITSLSSGSSVLDHIAFPLSSLKEEKNYLLYFIQQDIF